LAQRASSAREVIRHPLLFACFYEEFPEFQGMTLPQACVCGIACAVYGSPDLDASGVGVVELADASRLGFEVLDSQCLDVADTALPHVFTLTYFAVAAVASARCVGRALACARLVALEMKLGQEFHLPALAALLAAVGELFGDLFRGHLVVS